ncbi:Bax inhibitor-1/YccA family protein [Undibacterium sp. RTI2.1]|uniref:Bax inhibitor-1/YccA family protein n=1 Tax=unclassified Undibacterium TaxID=2630295 RepID=UPI002AB552C1|nr:MULTISPECIES: Bax inhibitor-1/YccA family protein [unclassified Undibacterium]MDY7539515.1 Bax inhibitor-1/YccA family protein [Undibacterium sp. 5I1]MEB0030181.1 Bax inhibitor-1/YccA family protein [Undibacterium sp. RTI2.1]MEB0116709.1 Bax inhibitor-1/YccA family protein [Undibacterium sp. RTI2.2]MEB0232510.1 Bax inhibitor-1/YccA family protein [Undibacterium sp. 10I3]MEB0259687.1 Bax inhibitor-1/YccA family protein [Undibacterium sp. 5I1]
MKILDRSALRNVQTVDYSDSNVDASHKVLRNTYMLLSMTLLFSALTAAASIAFALPSPGMIITLVGYFGLLFLTNKFRNSGLGILFVFALTGFMGLTIGPIISHYLGMAGGAGIVMSAMGLTGAIFLSLSAYVLVSKRDFSFMGGFLMIGMLVAFVASLGAIFFQIPALSLTISAAMVLLMSGMILFETSNIIRGGETNYIMATVSLYVTILNLFLSLLQLLGFIDKE